MPKFRRSSRIFFEIFLRLSSEISPYNKSLPIVSYLIILLTFGFSASWGRLNILDTAELTSESAFCMSVFLANSILNCPIPSLAVELTFLTPSITLTSGSIALII